MRPKCRQRLTEPEFRVYANVCVTVLCRKKSLFCRPYALQQMQPKPDNVLDGSACGRLTNQTI